MNPQAISLATWLPTLPQSERQTLAVVWDIPESELIQRLQADYLQNAVSNFDSAEQAAIQLLQTYAGVLPLAQLEHEFGAIRPHSGILAPRTYLMALQGQASPLERLFIRGLIHRVRTDDGFRYVLVDELRTPTTSKRTSEQPMLKPVATPRHWQAGEPLAFINDLLALLGIVYHSPLDLTAQGKLSRSGLSQLAQRLRLPAQEASSEQRWPDAGILRSIGLASDLLIERQGTLRIAVHTHTWLQQVLPDQWETLLEAWVEMPFDDLRDLLGLRWRTPPLVPPARYARRALLQLIKQFDGAWYSLEQVIAWLKYSVPDYARPDQRFDSWALSDANDSLLGGWRSWEQVDGALARALLSGPLHWLGLIDLGSTQGDVIMRVSEWARAYFGQIPYPETTWEPLELKPEGQLEVYFYTEPMTRFKVERIAEWHANDDPERETYQLSLRSFDRALDHGISFEQLIDFLRCQTARGLPKPLEHQLQTWQDQRTALHAESVFTLQATKPAYLDTLLNQFETKLPPATRYNPHTLAFNHADGSSVIEYLREHGYALASSVPRLNNTLHEGDLADLLVAAQVLRILSKHHQTSAHISAVSIERTRKRISTAELANIDRRTAEILAAWGIEYKEDGD